jgi:hypothetical protein
MVRRQGLFVSWCAGPSGSAVHLYLWALLTVCRMHTHASGVHEAGRTAG